MSYFKLDHNGLPMWIESLPSTWGKLSGLRSLPDTDLIQHGFFPVEDIFPAMDTESETLGAYTVDVQTDKVVRSWSTVDIPLGTVKNTALRFLKAQVEHAIYSRHPVYKQLNRDVVGRLTTEEITAMDSQIDVIRSEFNTSETTIIAASTSDAVKAEKNRLLTVLTNLQ